MTQTQSRTYTLTEKGAAAFRKFGRPAQVGDSYDHYARAIPEKVLRQYLRCGFIQEEKGVCR